MKPYFTVVSLILLAASSVEAKCGNSIIYIDGVITGVMSDTTVSVQVTPDPNWEPQPSIAVKADETFRAMVYFDRTKAEGRIHDNCSRKPDDVTVQLLKNGRTADQVHLTIKHDFVAKGRLDYETREPVKLHSN